MNIEQLTALAQGINTVSLRTLPKDVRVISILVCAGMEPGGGYHMAIGSPFPREVTHYLLKQAANPEANGATKILERTIEGTDG